MDILFLQCLPLQVLKSTSNLLDGETSDSLLFYCSMNFRGSDAGIIGSTFLASEALKIAPNLFP
jgi:hypothetical protein